LLDLTQFTGIKVQQISLLTIIFKRNLLFMGILVVRSLLGIVVKKRYNIIEIKA